MPAEAASASANTGINSPGGSNYENSPSVIIFIVLAIAIIFYFWKRKE